MDRIASGFKRRYKDRRIRARAAMSRDEQMAMGPIEGKGEAGA